MKSIEEKISKKRFVGKIKSAKSLFTKNKVGKNFKWQIILVS